MALREEFECRGNWLFQRRSYLPLGLVVVFLVTMFVADFPKKNVRLDRSWELLCLLVAALGLAIRVVTIGQVPRGTSGRNTAHQVADILNTSGIYSVVRHPLYLGNFFMWFGIALMPRNFLMALIFVLVYWLYYERILFAEEEYLRKKFGESFLAWARITPAFVPRLRQYSRSELTFCWRNVLRREYNGFFALVVVMFVMESIEEFKRHGKAAFDPGWLILLGLGVVTWLVLRTLKRHTTFLDTEGR